MAFVNLEVHLGSDAQQLYYALKEQRDRCLADAIRGAASDKFEISGFLDHWEDVEGIDGMMAYLFDQINYAASEYEMAAQTEGGRIERERLAADRRSQQAAYWSERFELSSVQVEAEQTISSSYVHPDQYLKSNSTSSDHDHTNTSK